VQKTLRQVAHECGQKNYPAQPKNTPPKLLDQVRERIHVKHYSIRIDKLYVQRIKRLFCFMANAIR